VCRTLEGRGVEGAAGAAAGAGAAMKKTFCQEVQFDISTEPTRWWGRCSSTVQVRIMLTQEK
jgi:hypothetical protein